MEHRGFFCLSKRFESCMSRKYVACQAVTGSVGKSSGCADTVFSCFHRVLCVHRGSLSVTSDEGIREMMLFGASLRKRSIWNGWGCASMNYGKAWVSFAQQISRRILRISSRFPKNVLHFFVCTGLFRTFAIQILLLRREGRKCLTIKLQRASHDINL